MQAWPPSADGSGLGGPVRLYVCCQGRPAAMYWLSFTYTDHPEAKALSLTASGIYITRSVVTLTSRY
jgi:hypothetical protein